jgi:drug/metabolite transporter (DMT)-like permease
MPYHKLALIYILGANALWGIAPAIIKLGLNNIYPFTFLFVRFLLSSIIILPFFYFELKRNPISLKQIPTPFFIGIVCYTISLSLVFLGIQKTTALDSSIIGAVEPIVVCLMGAVFLSEKISKTSYFGIALSLLGTLLIVLEPLWNQILRNPQNHTSERIIGNLLLCLYLITNGIYIVWSRKYFGGKDAVSPLSKVAIGIFSATITFFPLSALEIAIIPTSVYAANSSAIFPIFYMAVFSGFVAYLLHEKALKIMPASETVIFTYLQPVFAIPACFLLLKEIPSTAFAFGAFVILIGVFLAEHKKTRVVKTSSSLKCTT